MPRVTAKKGAFDWNRRAVREIEGLENRSRGRGIEVVQIDSESENFGSFGGLAEVDGVLFGVNDNWNEV